MEWNVFYYDFNSRQIKVFNIFDHCAFRKDVEQHLKKCSNKEEFAEKLRIELRYYFWSKCEWETVITNWPPYIKVDELNRLNAERDKVLKRRNKEPYCLDVNLNIGKKIDVYDQVMNNWSVFIDYVWSFKEN